MNDAYDEWVDALADGEGFYFACPEGHGSLPPRRTCPHCGATDLTQELLPETGALDTFSVLHVATPRFAAETPYAVGIADFGPVRLTGVVRDIDFDEIETGLSVEPGVDRTAGTDEPVVVLRPIR